MTTRLIVLIPLLAALLGLLTNRVRLGQAIAIGGAAVTFVLGLTAFFAENGAPSTRWDTLPPLAAGELSIPLTLVTGPALAAVAAVVTLVYLAVQAYAAWYLGEDDRYVRFASTVSLFSGAMLLVVHSGDLVLTLLGWEVMGWCSYLLIGHWSRERVPRTAAHKAFLVTRVADVGFVLGVIGLAAGAGTTETRVVVAHWVASDQGALRALLVSLLLIGVLGKSAQFPFQDWLPDAMAGPTPASALIHAATMVAAGTVVLAGIFDLLAVSDPARWLLALSTAVTMLMAALLALGQRDLKRLLAWSTVSQVAVMLSALSAVSPEAGPDAGLFHMWSHAIFKALLFLSIGWLGVLAGSTSAKALSGSAHGQRFLNLLFLAGLVSLAGVPFTVGGLSKEGVIEEAYNGAVGPGGPGLVVVVSLLLTAVVTALYSTRAYLVVTGPPATEPVEDGAHHGPHGAPNLLVRSLLGLLAVLSIIGGLFTLGSWLHLPEVSTTWVLVSVLVVGLGVGAAFLMGRRGDPADRLPTGYVTGASNGLGFDGIYRAAVARPVLALARLVARLDRTVLDGAIRALASGTVGLGALGSRAHRVERPSLATALVAVGMLVAAFLGVLAWS